MPLSMADAFRSFTSHLPDGPASFQVTVFESPAPLRTILFAVGRGGQPARHLPLLHHLAEQGGTVIAPHFDLIPTIPREEDLQTRARRLELAVQSFAPPAVPLAGVGHSIGATLLLVLAGAHAWTLARQRISRPTPLVFSRLALFAPATDFFRAPGALDSVHTPIVAWVGTHDPITPPAQAEFLRQTLGPRTSVEVRPIEGASHFTFMHDLPPGIEDPFPHRPDFLANLADEVSDFVAGG